MKFDTSCTGTLFAGLHAKRTRFWSGPFSFPFFSFSIYCFSLLDLTVFGPKKLNLTGQQWSYIEVTGEHFSEGGANVPAYKTV